MQVAAAEPCGNGFRKRAKKGTKTGGWRERTFFVLLFDVALAELLPPGRQVAAGRHGLGRRVAGGLGLPVAHARRDVVAAVVLHAGGHGGRAQRASWLSSGRRSSAGAACRGVAVGGCCARRGRRRRGFARQRAGGALSWAARDGLRVVEWWGSGAVVVRWWVRWCGGVVVRSWREGRERCWRRRTQERPRD